LAAFVADSMSTATLREACITASVTPWLNPQFRLSVV
jgi:hypothetical protein